MESISLVPNTILNSLYVNERKNCTGGSVVLDDRHTIYFMQVTDTTNISIDSSLLNIPTNCSLQFKLVVWSDKANVLNFSGCSIEQIEVKRGESTFTIQWTGGTSVWSVIPDVLSGYTEVPLMAYRVPNTVQSIGTSRNLMFNDNYWVRDFNVFTLLMPYQKNTDNWIYGQCYYKSTFAAIVWSVKPFMLTKLQFHWTSNYSASDFPNSVTVYGSNDNTNWMPIISNAALTFSVGAIQDIIVTGTNTFFKAFKFEFSQSSNNITCLPPISIIGYEGTQIDNYRYSYLVPAINTASNGYDISSNSSDMSSVSGTVYNLLYDNGDDFNLQRANTSINFEYTFTLPFAQSICGIFFRTAGAGTSPTLLTISGSNNGTDWTEISKLMAYTLYGGNGDVGRFKECPYLFAETAEYSYYKVTVIDTNSSGNAYCNFRMLNLIKKTTALTGFETIMPKMSSNSQDGYVVSASNTVEGNVYNMFDSNAGYFHVGTIENGEWIVHIQLPQATVIKGICMYDRPDGYYAQAPYAFTVQGSNNNEDWTILDTENLGSSYWNSRGQLGIFPFENNTAYTYYRLVCTASNYGNYCAIAELGLMTDPYLPNVNWTEDEYIVPIMTSDSQDGYVASASSEFDGSHHAYNAFDGSTYDKWASSSSDSDAWLQIQLPTAKICNVITLNSGTDGNYYGECPTQFEFKGSNDGTNWTTLTSQTGVTWTSAGQNKTFEFSNSTAYSYYRLTISANGNGYAPFSVGELYIINRIVHN